MNEPTRALRLWIASFRTQLSSFVPPRSIALHILSALCLVTAMIGNRVRNREGDPYGETRTPRGGGDETKEKGRKGEYNAQPIACYCQLYLYHTVNTFQPIYPKSNETADCI